MRKMIMHVLITSANNSNLLLQHEEFMFNLDEKKIFSSLSNIFCINEMKREFSIFDYILYIIKREANKGSNTSTIIIVLVFILSLLYSVGNFGSSIINTFRVKISKRYCN